LKRPARIALAATVLVLLTAGGGLALAAGSSLTIEVKGQYAKRYRTVCGKVHKHFRFFHRGSRIEARGFLAPAPSGHVAIRLQIKRCISGRWVEIANRQAQAKPLTGEFKAFFSARPLAPHSHKRRAVVYERVRARIGSSVLSTYEYYAVTN
jgi:hypothetical protein